MVDPTLLRPRRAPWRRFVLDIVQTIVQAVALYLIVAAVFGRFEIRQISMEPNFHEGQRVLVFQLGSTLSPVWARTAYAAGEQHAQPFTPARGQVVILYPDAERAQEPLIKRVIGLPGDTVEIREGGVWVNGSRLSEPYLRGKVTNCFGQCGPLTLGPDQYYVMGDNRPNSRDSRSFGPIPGSQIVGWVIVRYWPLNEIEVYP